MCQITQSQLLINIFFQELFVILLYDKASNQNHVSDAWMYHFKNHEIKNASPTQSVLQQHINRTVFQAGYIWCQPTEF